MMQERIKYEDDLDQNEHDESYDNRDDYEDEGYDNKKYRRPRRRFNRRRSFRPRRLRKFFKVEVVLADDVTTLQMPEKMTSGSAGYDLKSVEDFTINPGETCHKVRTGVKVKIPYGTVGLLSMRSSIGDKGIILTNAPGQIDSDYRGEIFGTIHNLSKEPISIKAGERIFQLTFVPVRIGDIVNVPEFSPDKFKNERGEGGFGSTNKTIENVNEDYK